MEKFQRDMEFMINEGFLVANNGKIRFIFRYSQRLNDVIEWLKLSERSYNCLRRNGISTMKEIGDKWDDLWRLKTCGQKSIEEIKNKYLAFYYSTLKTDEERAEFWTDTINATAEM